ncbi:hypothetical protein P43SY_002060 [Pythium insidiosum]|uniref:Uncharacterized protein n=1 Tax=Pythium insidiosum TaxID=114742 RepID=A0AAD5LGJ7_PYTIN|nr:hypothetical protein P43SY_002060 [Pythium insidiosum]
MFLSKHSVQLPDGKILFLNRAETAPTNRATSRTPSARTARLFGAASGIINDVLPQPQPQPQPQPPTPQPPQPPACPTPAYSSCGNSAGTTCCPSGFFCQPRNPDFYQCIPTPQQCGEQFTDTDFYGNDIKTVYVSLPSLCCDEFARTPGCNAYTYVNDNPGQPVCYLKSAAGEPSRLVGAAPPD